MKQAEKSGNAAPQKGRSRLLGRIVFGTIFLFTFASRTITQILHELIIIEALKRTTQATGILARLAVKVAGVSGLSRLIHNTVQSAPFQKFQKTLRDGWKITKKLAAASFRGLQKLTFQLGHKVLFWPVKACWLALKACGGASLLKPIHTLFDKTLKAVRDNPRNLWIAVGVGAAALTGLFFVSEIVFGLAFAPVLLVCFNKAFRHYEAVKAHKIFEENKTIFNIARGAAAGVPVLGPALEGGTVALQQAVSQLSLVNFLGGKSAGGATVQISALGGTKAGIAMASVGFAQAAWYLLAEDERSRHQLSLIAAQDHKNAARAESNERATASRNTRDESERSRYENVLEHKPSRLTALDAISLVQFIHHAGLGLDNAKNNQPVFDGVAPPTMRTEYTGTNASKKLQNDAKAALRLLVEQAYADKKHLLALRSTSLQPSAEALFTEMGGVRKTTVTESIWHKMKRAKDITNRIFDRVHGPEPVYNPIEMFRAGYTLPGKIAHWIRGKKSTGAAPN